MARITYARFMPTAKVLFMSDEDGKKYSFQVINNVPPLRNGRGFMQELRGRFDAAGNLDVRDIHNDQASDFEIVCGPRLEVIRKGQVRVWDEVYPTSSEFSDPIANNITIRVFAGSPPPSSLKQDVGTIWISDPNRLLWEKLSESADPKSDDLDQSEGSLSVCQTEPVYPSTGMALLKFVLNGEVHVKPTGYVQKCTPSTLVVTKRRILNGPIAVTFEIR